MEKMPSREPIPAWYEISCRDEGRALALEVHPLALGEMEKVKWVGSPLLKHIGEEYGLMEFTPPRKGECGFGNVLKPADPDNEGWIAWAVPLPIFKGSQGFQASADNYSIQVRATLSTISNCLWLFEGDTGHAHNQLIVIESIHLPDKKTHFHQGSLSATLTPDAISWIAKQPADEDVGPVVEAMRNADKYMWPGGREDYRFGARCRRPKWIHLDVPGNACGLDPEDRYSDSLEQGYQLVPHNTDTALQQFTFLAGLAKLHDCMRGR